METDEEMFTLSAKSLKDILDIHGYAENENPAWGICFMPLAKRLPNGDIEVRTYHFEGEWQTEIYKTELEAVYSLYSDCDAWWHPGIWTEPES